MGREMMRLLFQCCYRGAHPRSYRFFVYNPLYERTCEARYFLESNQK